MKFDKIVKSIRIQLNMSQKEFAHALNVSFATINRWENGHVIPSNLAQRSFYDFCEDNFIDITKLSDD